MDKARRALFGAVVAKMIRAEIEAERWTIDDDGRVQPAAPGLDRCTPYALKSGQMFCATPRYTQHMLWPTLEEVSHAKV